MLGSNEFVVRCLFVLSVLIMLAGCGEKTPDERVDGKTRKMWMLQLEEFSPTSKAEAISALARFEDPPLDILAKHLTEGGRQVRVAAIRGLGDVGAAAAPHAATLAKLLEDPPEGTDPRTAKALRNAAMEALGGIGAEAFPAFSYMLVSESPALRARAVYTLRPFVRDLKDGINTVMNLMQDEHAVVRRETAKTLGVAAEGSADRRASDALITALNDLDSSVSAAAAIALGSLGGSSDREGKALANLLYNHRQSVRASAAYGLGLMGEEADPYLKQVTDLMKNDNRGVVRIQAARAHFRISGDATAALAQLEKDIQTGDTGLCRDAIKAIGEMGPAAAPAVDSLVLHLDKEALRLHAARALGAIGPDAASALPHLDKAAESADPDSPVRLEIDASRSLIRGE